MIDKDPVVIAGMARTPIGAFQGELGALAIAFGLPTPNAAGR